MRGQENTGVLVCRGARPKGRHQPFYITCIIVQTNNEGMGKDAKTNGKTQEVIVEHL